MLAVGVASGLPVMGSVEVGSPVRSRVTYFRVKKPSESHLFSAIYRGPMSLHL